MVFFWGRRPCPLRGGGAMVLKYYVRYIMVRKEIISLVMSSSVLLSHPFPLLFQGDLRSQQDSPHVRQPALPYFQEALSPGPFLLNGGP
jgi:hypothetical protein